MEDRRIRVVFVCVKHSSNPIDEENAQQRPCCCILVYANVKREMFLNCVISKLEANNEMLCVEKYKHVIFLLVQG